MKVPIPENNHAMIRFTREKGSFTSDQIADEQHIPFTHCEAVLHDGSIVAALLVEGVGRHPNDYYPNVTRQRFAILPMDRYQYAMWESYLLKKVEEKAPYDNAMMAAFLTGLQLHEKGAFMCSTLMGSALVAAAWCTFPNNSAGPFFYNPYQLLECLEADARVILLPSEWTD